MHSDIPAEPSNESSSQSESDLPAGLAQPALRALHGAGIWRLAQLATYREVQIKQLHGIGPRALKQLQQALETKGLSFTED